MILKLKSQGTPIISEIEFAGRYTNAKMICITGSNGTVSYTHLDVYKRQRPTRGNIISSDGQLMASSLPEYKIYMDFMINKRKGETEEEEKANMEKVKEKYSGRNI